LLGKRKEPKSSSGRLSKAKARGENSHHLIHSRGEKKNVSENSIKKTGEESSSRVPWWREKSASSSWGSTAQPGRFKEGRLMKKKNLIKEGREAYQLDRWPSQIAQRDPSFLEKASKGENCHPDHVKGIQFVAYERGYRICGGTDRKKSLPSKRGKALKEKDYFSTGGSVRPEGTSGGVTGSTGNKGLKRRERPHPYLKGGKSRNGVQVRYRGQDNRKKREGVCCPATGKEGRQEERGKMSSMAPPSGRRVEATFDSEGEGQYETVCGQGIIYRKKGRMIIKKK